MDDGKEKSCEKVLRKPGNICKIDNSFTRIQIAPEVEMKQMEDLKTGKMYKLIRTGRGIQVMK